MKIELNETAKFQIVEEVTLDNGNTLMLACPRCGKEVILNAKSPSGDEYLERHVSCRMEFELRPTGYQLVMTGNG